jgi:AmmeMemoRadiSam system protein A
MSAHLTDEERALLLTLARQALEDGVCRRPRPALEITSLPPTLQQPGATFVTLTLHGELRGCIGTLEAYQPLAEDAREHAVAAALNDFRFPPVSPEELPDLRLEISRLTPPQPLEYEKPADLPSRLRPGIDGVLLRDGFQRATFLPQVWEKIPDAEHFLDQLCQKMGSFAGLWRTKILQVYTYQIEEFHEAV